MNRLLKWLFARRDVWGITFPKFSIRRVVSFVVLLCLIATPTLASAVTPMVASGSADHSFAISADGNVYAWGSDEMGQLGIGRPIFVSTPQSILGLNLGVGSGRSRIASGDSHNVTVKSDGSVWAWGRNNYGQVGDGSTVDRTSPVQVPGLTGIVTVAAGEHHSLAVRSDGSVWAWGDNNFGQLGDGTTINRTSPVQVSGLTGVVAMAGGIYHSLALKSDGSVWAWGYNYYGQLGDGTITTGRSTPVQVPGLAGVVAVAASSYRSFALKSDGSVWAWGWNDSGQLGDGTTTNRTSPVQVSGLTGVVAVAGGYMDTIAVKSDGSVWAWGNNSYGRLGDGTTTDRTSPVLIAGLNGIVTVAMGAYHSLALKSDGSIWGWGFNTSGQIGVGPSGYVLSSPEMVPDLSSVVEISGGYGHTIAVKSDGSVWAWGDNNFGQLGSGTTTNRTSPVRVSGLTDVVAVGGGYLESIALTSDGSVWQWGHSNSTPIRMSGLTGIVAVAEGHMHSLALKSDGSVWTWGASDWSGIGGTSGLEGVPVGGQGPVQISGLSGVVAVSAGNAYSLALKSDGSVWAWGFNQCGQLGDGTIINRASPVQVSGLIGVKALVANGCHTLALKSDGSVWEWGLGASTPRQVVELIGVVAVAAGANHSLALKSDGSVWAWGSNESGQLGDGKTANGSLPGQVFGLADVAGIAAGANFSLARKSDGAVFSWGANNSGQLGDGTFAQRLFPVLVVNENNDGFLNLNPGTDFTVPPSVGVPFFVAASGGITDTSATVKTTTKFNPPDVGKTGAVYVTARAASGSMRALSARAPGSGSSTYGAWSALTAADSFELLQLTATGWQSVVNGQLIAYASGVLGNQMSAQAILDNTDTTNLKGAQFCVGYGVSAEEMIAAGAMRVVATIPDPSATGATTVSCVVTSGESTSSTTSTTTTTTQVLITTTSISATTSTTQMPTTTTTVVSTTTTTQPQATVNFVQGWNLAGNGSDAPINVAATFSDTNSFTTVWKWIAAKSAWAFHAPSLAAQGGTALADYVAAKGYQPLATIAGGEGFWVNAKTAASINLPSGNVVTIATFGSTVVKGWNLISIGQTTTPKQFCDVPTAGAVTTLWAWDATKSAWYFYAPSLATQGGTTLSDYIANKGYLDFSETGKTLGPGVGFWVNKP